MNHVTRQLCTHSRTDGIKVMSRGFSGGKLACEQALRGALAAEPEKEGEFATTSLEFEYLHRKSRCELLIGGDDISNDVITLGACPHLFFNVCLHSRSFPLRADWWKSDSSVDGEPHRNWRRIKRRSCKLSFLLPPCCQSVRACASSRLRKKKNELELSIS